MTPDFQTNDADRNLYARQMERVKLRVSEAGSLLRSGGDERSLLYAAVQLRLAIEEVAFSSLVGNRQAMEQAERSLKLNDWDKVRKALRAVNEKYWPKGIVQVKGGTEWADAESPLYEHDCARVWGRLSSLLHARSPWLPELNWQAEKQHLLEVVTN